MDIQAYIEEPEISIITMSSSSIQDQAALIVDRMKDMSTPLHNLWCTYYKILLRRLASSSIWKGHANWWPLSMWVMWYTCITFDDLLTVPTANGKLRDPQSLAIKGMCTQFIFMYTHVHSWWLNLSNRANMLHLSQGIPGTNTTPTSTVFLIAKDIWQICNKPIHQALALLLFGYKYIYVPYRRSRIGPRFKFFSTKHTCRSIW